MCSTKVKVPVYCRRPRLRNGQGGGFDGKALAEPLFDALITIDRNIRYQQNLTGREIAILILCVQSNDINDIAPLVPNALAALGALKPGQAVEVTLS